MSKLAIITGADGGMGTEITRAVAQAGYHVIMLCYTLFKGEERKNQLILETGNKEIEVRQVVACSYLVRKNFPMVKLYRIGFTKMKKLI